MAYAAYKAGDKVFCTKYGVTEGKLYSYSVQKDSGKEEQYVNLVNSSAPGSYLFVSKKDCFTSKDEALKTLEAVNAKKIQSLQKQIEKLQKISYVEKSIS